MFVGEGEQAEIVWESINISDENMESIVSNSSQVTHQGRTVKKVKKFERSARQAQVKYLTRSRLRIPEKSTKSKTIFDCPNNCGSSFFQKITLDRHLKFVCGQPLRYKCPYCNMSSRVRNCVNTHVKARHPDLKTYVIDLSPPKTEPHFEEDFNSPHIIQKVEPIWNEEQEIKILNVSSLASLDIKHEYETFKTEDDDNSLDNSSTRTRKKFVCPNNCGNSYKHEHTLKVHLQFACNRTDHPNNFHLDDDESDSEPEDVKPTNTDELLNPMATGDEQNFEQNAEGKWICSNKCGGTFSTRGNLNYHLKTHCGLRPKLECPYCLHRSRKPGNGFIHVKTKHPGAEICLVHVDTGEVLKSKKNPKRNSTMNLSNGSSAPPEESKKPSGKAATTCQHCGKEFKLQATLARHLYEGCGYPPRFKCPYCDYQVRRLSYAFFHVSKHHPGCEVYMVDLVTGDSITDPAQIKKEAIADIAEDKKPFLIAPDVVPQAQKTAKTHPAGLQKKRLACPHSCGRTFFFGVSLEKHMKNCQRNRNVSQDRCRHKCPYCDNRYEHQSSLFRHIKSSHHRQRQYAVDTYDEEIVPENANSPVIPKTEPLPKAKRLPKQEPDDKTDDNLENKDSLKTYVCPNKCGSSFDHFCNVQRHIKLNCAKARRYKCPKCNYRAQKFLIIAKHIKANHKMSKIYAVDFYTKKQITSEFRHRPRSLRPKTEAEPVIAAPLPKPTAQKNRIQKRVPCPNNCGRSFESERSLIPHLKHICGKSSRYRCPYCPQICRHQGNMTTHIKHRHPGKKNYMIDITKKKPARTADVEPAKVKMELKFSSLEIKRESIVEEKKREERRREERMREAKIAEQKSTEEKKEEKKPKELSQAAIFGNPLKRKTSKLFNYRKRRIMCPHKCGKYFSSHVKLKLHIQTVCKKPITTKCPHCSKVSKYLWNMDRHIKKYHPEHLDNNDQKAESDPKNENEEEEEEEEVELKLTDNIEDEPLQEANPDDTKLENNETEKMDDHEKNEDVEMKPIKEVETAEDEVETPNVSLGSTETKEPRSPMKKFPCPNNCGKSYPKKSSLKNHLIYTCQKPSRYKCPYCDNCAKVSSNGYVHVKRMHPNQKNYLIDLENGKIICGSKLQPTSSLDPMDTDSAKNESVANTTKDLDAVEDMEIENDANADIDVDEPDEPDEPILGTEEELFANDPVISEQSLDEKEERFVCPNNCGSAFTNEHKLTNHVRDHCGPPRFKCPYCFFITREPSNVYAHIKNKHPEERIYMIDTDMNQSCNEPDSPPGNEEN